VGGLNTYLLSSETDAEEFKSRNVKLEVDPE
jgi:hypothetical protein